VKPTLLLLVAVLMLFCSLLIFSPIGKKVSDDGEFPINTIDDFVQSGEVSDSSDSSIDTTSVSIGDIAEDIENSDVEVQSEPDGSSAHMFTIGAVSIVASFFVVAFV
jgi:hypothetical protein